MLDQSQVTLEYFRSIVELKVNQILKKGHFLCYESVITNYIIYKHIDRWIDGWVDGWIDRQIDRQIDKNKDLFNKWAKQDEKFLFSAQATG